MMEAAGGKLVKHIRDLAFMGFAEVLMNIRTILSNFRLCREDLMQYKPDVLILVDYPGFNLRMAKFASSQGIKVFYYISPQVWAWKKSRVHKIRKYVDRMFVILPFEKDFYKRYDYDVDFVGHPLLDAIDTEATDKNMLKEALGLTSEPVIALLPGSRVQEIKTMLPVMAQMAYKFEDYQFVIAAMPSHPADIYSDLVRDANVIIIPGRMHDLLRVADAALVTSGTATLETALFKVPEVVCYKGGWLSYFIARMLIRNIKYISLVNLIMDREVVKELIQGNFNSRMVQEELSKILIDGPARKRILSDLDELLEILGGQGASRAAAELMYGRLPGSGHAL
jgi:lipid-A-disaccharide synthase